VATRSLIVFAPVGPTPKHDSTPRCLPEKQVPVLDDHSRPVLNVWRFSNSTTQNGSVAAVAGDVNDTNKTMELALIGNTILRAAIQLNLVSFPSQIPAFVKRGDAQVRIVQLYFVRRWTVRAICERYGLKKATVQKLLTEWRIRAVSAGYIQEVHPKVLAMFATEETVSLQEIFEASEPDTCIAAPSQSEWELTPPPQPDQVVSALAPS